MDFLKGLVGGGGRTSGSGQRLGTNHQYPGAAAAAASSSSSSSSGPTPARQPSQPQQPQVVEVTFTAEEKVSVVPVPVLLVGGSIGLSDSWSVARPNVL
jgi:hypothetical protein